MDNRKELRIARLIMAVCAVLIVAVLFVGFAGMAQARGAVKTAKALPATVTPTDPTDFGLGLGTCFYDGSVAATAAGLPSSITVKSCLGVAPPPAPGTNCNPKGILSSTLDVEHDVRAKVNLGSFATLYLWYSLGCGSVWGAVHVDFGCHIITDIQIYDDSTIDGSSGYTQGGLDPNGVLKCANTSPWESTFMVPGFSNSHATASATVDLTPQQATITV